MNVIYLGALKGKRILNCHIDQNIHAYNKIIDQ